MLNYRRREREQKSLSEEAEKCRANCLANHPFPEVKKDDAEVLRQYVTLPATTTNLLPKEITAVEPFNAFPIKIELYMLELLSSCECLSPLPRFLLPAF
jgi:hypothetical protein